MLPTVTSWDLLRLIHDCRLSQGLRRDDQGLRVQGIEVQELEVQLKLGCGDVLAEYRHVVLGGEHLLHHCLFLLELDVAHASFLQGRAGHFVGVG